MKVLVCGGRDFNDYDRLEHELHKTQRAYGNFTIISGCARGADSLAIKYAEQYGHQVEKFPALWEEEGRAAGPLRNIRMLEQGKPDLVLAFPGGKGTAHMVKIANEAGVEVIEA